MRTRMVMIARGESGKILVLALVLLVLGALLLTPLLGLMSTGLTAGQTYERKTAELYAADAGVEDAVHWLIHGKPEEWDWALDPTDPVWNRSTPIDINDRSVAVVVREIADNTFEITSTATSADGGSTTVVSTVWAVPKFQGCYEEEGLELGQNQSTIIDGDLYVVGDVELNQHSGLVVNGGVIIEGSLIMQHNTSITAEVLCLTGDLVVGNHVTVATDLHFLGDDCRIVMDGSSPTSRIIGNIWAEGNLGITVSQGAQNDVEIECPDGIYVPNGTISVHLDKNNSELRGDIFALVINPITGNGQHTGYLYHFDGEAKHWERVDDQSETSTDPPFEILPCPDITTYPVMTYTYEIT